MLTNINSQKKKTKYKIAKQSDYRAPTFSAIFPNNNLKSFSNGVRFKSMHIPLLLFDLFKTGTCSTWLTEEKLWFMEALCLLMWPPSACPNENSCPQMVHSCILGLVIPKLRDIAFGLSSSPSSFDLLWLALCPPNA